MTTSIAASSTTPASPPASNRPRPRAIADTLVLARRSVTVVFRTPTVIIANAFLPVVLLSVMTASFAKIVMPGADYSDYVNQVLPLFAVMGLVFASVDTGLAAHKDLHSGMDSRLRAMPMSRFAPLTGRILGDAVRNLMTLMILLAVGVGLGFRFTAGVLPAVGAVALMMLFGSCFAWIPMLAALISKSAESMATVLTGLLLVLSFLSVGFVPLDDLPAWAQPVARINPVSSVVEAVRALAHGGPTAAPVLKTLAWSAVIAIGFGALSLKRYRKEGR